MSRFVELILFLSGGGQEQSRQCSYRIGSLVDPLSVELYGVLKPIKLKVLVNPSIASLGLGLPFRISVAGCCPKL